MAFPYTKVVLGITGGISAYKAAELARLLVKSGVHVEPVLTRSGAAFITPLTLQALTGNPCHTELLDPTQEAGMGHIQLAKFAEAILIAPASAHFIAKLAHGLADDLLSTLCLASTAKIIVAPAMNQQMWRAKATKANIATLVSRGVQIIGPGEGIQACGDTGPGRLVEPEDIMALLNNTDLENPEPLNICITAGPTREALDPVRYLTNHSSGKMGYALAKSFVEKGHKVTLISGPTQLEIPSGLATYRGVTTAEEMYEACKSQAASQHIFISTAAVADYKAKNIQSEKIKKSETDLTLTLEKNPDILAQISEHFPNLFTVGFAAETNNVHAYAKEKLVRKNLDMICANEVGKQDAGFNSDNNQVAVITSTNTIELPYASKTRLAEMLYDRIIESYHEKYSVKSTR